MNNIIHLDLDKVKLFGWERRKGDLSVDSIMKGIEAGDEFPAVSVYKGEKGKFYLNCLVDGGHCRAVGHYIAGKPLKCELLKGTLIYPDIIADVAIPEIMIVDDTGQFQRKKIPQL